MKIGLNFFGLLSFLMIFLVSCSEDVVTPITEEVNFNEEMGLEEESDLPTDLLAIQYQIGEEALGAGNRCYTLVFPVTIVFPDGSTQEVSSPEEGREALKSYFEANGRGSERPTLEFPVEVVNMDGDTLSVASQEALKTLIEECHQNRRPVWKQNCFELVFPVTVILPNGDEVEVASQEELRKLYARAKRSGKIRRGVHPVLKLPFDVTLVDDGSVVTIETRDDLKAVIEDCRG